MRKQIFLKGIRYYHQNIAVSVGCKYCNYIYRNIYFFNREFGHRSTGHRVVHKMSLLFFSFLFHPPIPKSGNLLKLDQGRDLGFKIKLWR